MPEFMNFEVFYSFWRADFKRPCDPVLVFCHYIIIQNEYKSLRFDDKRSELLPVGWNQLNQDNETQLLYVKHDGSEKLRMEVMYEDVGNKLNLCFRTLSDFNTSQLALNLDDYISEDFRNENINETFKSNKFYKLFRQIIHALSRIKATVQPVESNGQRESVDSVNRGLDPYAYESPAKQRLNLGDDLERFDSLVGSRIVKKRKRRIWLKSANVKRRRSTGSRSSAAFTVNQEERDPLNVVSVEPPQPEAPPSPPPPVVKMSPKIASLVKEEAMVVEDTSIQVMTTPKQATTKGQCSLTSWFKKLTPPSASASNLDRSLGHSSRHIHSLKSTQNNPITNYYMKSIRDSSIQSMQQADIKLTCPCTVVIANIFPHGITGKGLGKN